MLLTRGYSLFSIPYICSSLYIINKIHIYYLYMIQKDRQGSDLCICKRTVVGSGEKGSSLVRDGVGSGVRRFGGRKVTSAQNEPPGLGFGPGGGQGGGRGLRRSQQSGKGRG